MVSLYTLLDYRGVTDTIMQIWLNISDFRDNGDQKNGEAAIFLINDLRPQFFLLDTS